MMERRGPDGQAPAREEKLPHLTRTERRLLEALRGRAGQVITRAELVRGVLGDPLASARTVDVHIRALRKKLGPAARILTIRGAGYTWDDPDSGDESQPPAADTVAPGSSAREREAMFSPAPTDEAVRAVFIGGIDRMIDALAVVVHGLLEVKAAALANQMDRASARYEAVMGSFNDLVEPFRDEATPPGA